MSRRSWERSDEEAIMSELGMSATHVRELVMRAKAVVSRADKLSSIQEWRRYAADCYKRNVEAAYEAEEYAASNGAIDGLARIFGLNAANETQLRVVTQGLQQSEEWQRLKTILVSAARRFVDERDTMILLEAIDVFEGKASELEASEVPMLVEGEVVDEDEADDEADDEEEPDTES